MREELSDARMEHIRWVEQIKAAMEKGVLPELTNHHDCNLGKWLYTKGKLKF
ncbi:CZB domain-containing protein [Deltaproteobacteria bacterium TL4]